MQETIPAHSARPKAGGLVDVWWVGLPWGAVRGLELGHAWVKEVLMRVFVGPCRKQSQHTNAPSEGWGH